METTGYLVRVESEVFGAVPKEESLPAVELDLAALEAALEERVTVSELIGRVVEEQVRDLLAREHRGSTPEDWSREVLEVLERQYLTPREIEDGARSGSVRLPTAGTGSETGGGERVVDVAREAARARRAFERGAYYVIVEGRQMGGLDEIVEYGPGTRITFLRVMPLAGG